MKDPLLIDALRARDPGAPAALYDAHGESLYRYCWFMVRNRDTAALALRDAMVAAEAHIARLRSPDLLASWLYALARGECLRREQAPGATHDAAAGRPGQPDADRRLIAWHAVMSLAPGEREALELTIRHGLSPEQAALVMDQPAGELPGLLDAGRTHLEQALAGEILARHGVAGCPEGAEALHGWAGEMTASLRERLVAHASSCGICGRYLPRNVSATKVYNLLLVPVPPPDMRLQVMTCFTDPDLVSYRMFTAARIGAFNVYGFPAGESAVAATPAAEARAAVVPSPRRPSGRLWAGPAAAVVAVAVVVVAVIAIGKMGGGNAQLRSMSASSRMTSDPAVTGPATPTGRPGYTPATRPAPGTKTSSPAKPAQLYLHSSTPIPDRSSRPGGSRSGGSSPGQGTVRMSPTRLVLGSGTAGQVTLRATGGPVSWSAQSSSPALTLSVTSGTVAAGGQEIMTVTVSRDQVPSGTATVTFGPFGAVLTVSWSDPVSNPPPPTGSPSPTGTPSASPSPPVSPPPAGARRS